MSVRILQGDCLDVLKTLPDQSVHCCVTSPPYWGLRDYGGCDCGTKRYFDAQGEGTGGAMNFRTKEPDVSCSKCGGTGRIAGTELQLGLESTPAEYVEKLVAVFREVRRCLRGDGTLWLNLGDSYAGGGNYRGVNSEDTLTSKQRSNGGARGVSQLLGSAGKDFGLEPKNLVGIPWRVAFALQADGWYLRQDIIWAKPNPMPESVRDRCTKSHEYIFLLAKSERYYFDNLAIAEPSTEFSRAETGVKFGGNNRCPDTRLQSGKEWKPTMGGGGTSFLGHSGNFKADGTPLTGPTRNKRSVWTVATQPFKEAHFATFPPSLIEPCILAGCPVGGTVLDPFGGAGTSGLVADRLQRDAILIELNGSYADMARARVLGDCPMFAEVAT